MTQLWSGQEKFFFFLHLAHRLDMVHVCAKLFENISMHDKVIVQTRKVQLKSISYHCDLDLESTNIFFAFGTSS